MPILYAGVPEQKDAWIGSLQKLDPDLSFRVWPDWGEPDAIDFGATIHIAIATATGTALRRARILGGRDWVRLGAVEMGLDCLRRQLQGLPVDERIDFEKV